jgi:O-acetyl-ADP-ribose deacetylase (regulator of RNase III)
MSGFNLGRKDAKEITYNINGLYLTLILGDVVNTGADAILIPQFNTGGPYAGGAKSIIDTYGMSGVSALNEYNRLAHEKEFKFGDILLSASKDGKKPNLIHVVTVDSDKDREFSVIQEAIFKTLVMAKNKGIKRVSCPMLGTGALGNLTIEQSTKAILSSWHRFIEAYPENDIMFNLIVFDDKSSRAEQEFNIALEVVSKEKYQNAKPEQGQKEFSFTDLLYEIHSGDETYRKYMKDSKNLRKDRDLKAKAEQNKKRIKKIQKFKV